MKPTNVIAQEISEKYSNIPDLSEIQTLTKMINDPEQRNIYKFMIAKRLKYTEIYKNVFVKTPDLTNTTNPANTPNAAHLEAPLCCQTIAQHKNVLWSLSNRHRSSYFKRMLASIKTKRIKVSFENINDVTLSFIDFRKRSKYNFMVHTTSGLPKTLEKTLQSGADFIQSTPFFSCSLVDKNTVAAIMHHQDNIVQSEADFQENVTQRKVLFHISLILDLEDDAVLQAFPVDAFSPMLSKCTDKDNLVKVSTDYITYLKSMQEYFNKREALISAALTQAETLSTTSLSTFDLDQMFKILCKDSAFRMPASNKTGLIPQLTPKQILKQTRSGFNEVIVAGKSNNKVIGILVEQSSLKMFKERLKKLQGDELKQAHESLTLLSSSKYPLILVNSRKKGIKHKISPTEKFMNLYAAFQADAPVINQELLRYYRLTKSRPSEMGAGEIGEGDADYIKKLNKRLTRHVKKLNTMYKKLDLLKEEITGQRKEKLILD